MRSLCCVSGITNSVANHAKEVIKAYEHMTSLPYDEVPPELCRPRPGTREIDLSAWSLVVTDASLRQIAAGDRDRIKELAWQSSIDQVAVRLLITPR